MLPAPEPTDKTWPIPAGEGRLLAMLYPADFCRAELLAAESREAYDQCAKWLQALESGLPEVVNAILGQLPAGENPSLFDDVGTPEALVQVLRQLAAKYEAEPDADQFDVDHPASSRRGLFFTWTFDSPAGVSCLFYDGCFKD